MMTMFIMMLVMTTKVMMIRRTKVILKITSVTIRNITIE